MKDQALIKNKYVDFLYEQISLENEMGVDLTERIQESYLVSTLPKIVKAKKVLSAILVTEDMNKNYVFAIGNLDSSSCMSTHIAIQLKINEKFGFDLANDTTRFYSMGITLLLGENSDKNEKLVAFLDKPRVTGLLFDSVSDYYEELPNILKDYGIDSAYLLKTEENIDFGSSINPIQASSIIDLYTNEVVL